MIIKLWEHTPTDVEMIDMLSATARAGKHKLERIRRTWARSYISDRKYYYKRDKSYLNINFAFDIETTRHPETDTAYMYIWQFGINGHVILGTEWNEFFDLLKRIKTMLHPRENDRVIIWDHNLPYEFAFIKRYISYNDDYFFMDARQPVYFTHDNFFQFQDSLRMVNGASLAKLAKDHCTTQKAVGDLDYDILRNKTDAKHMTVEEYGYCINDVKILCEYGEYYWNTYMKHHYCPVTGNSVLRSEIKAGMTATDKSEIQMQFPTPDLYTLLTSCVYRGGYVHGNSCFMGELFTSDDNIGGVDFTSAYPAWMLEMSFPGEYVKHADVTVKEFVELSKTQWCIGVFEFVNIRNTYPHAIESLSKCFNADEIWKDKKHTIIDNGRILRSRHLITALDTLSFYNYQMYYNWDAVKITDVYVADQIKLPRYLIKPMLKYYKLKGELKRAGKSYSLEKTRLNSFYGICVTRIATETVMLDEHGNTECVPDFDFQKATKGAFLLPQWGVQISSYCRFMLLSIVKRLEDSGHHVLYCDTDSIKALNWNADADKIIHEYNVRNLERVKSALVYYGESGDGIISSEGDTIGDFDKEYDCLENFKMLGAKRYCFTNKGKFKSTIAGLPKDALMNYYKFIHKKQNINSVYDLFEDGLSIQDCKLASIYYDEPTQAVINGEVMQEMSSVCLTPTSFTLGLTEDFKELIQWLEANKGKEYRR